MSIDDESLRTMQAAGLVAEVMRDLAAHYGSHYMSSSGRCFARVEPATREYGFPRRNAFSQPLFEKTLLDGLARFSNVTMLFRHTVDALSEESDGVTLVSAGLTIVSKQSTVSRSLAAMECEAFAANRLAPGWLGRAIPSAGLLSTWQVRENVFVRQE